MSINISSPLNHRTIRPLSQIQIKIKANHLFFSLSSSTQNLFKNVIQCYINKYWNCILNANCYLRIIDVKCFILSFDFEMK